MNLVLVVHLVDLLEGDIGWVSVDIVRELNLSWVKVGQICILCPSVWEQLLPVLIDVLPNNVALY